jgi:copper transport protein
MKTALALLLLALASALAFPASPAHAQIELTETDPPDGAELDAPPDVVHLCFSQPVIIEDNTTFAFNYQMSDGRLLGLRIVFQTDGECVDVYPGLPDEYPAGEYTFEWQVTAAEGDEEGSGTLRFQVTTGSTPTPSPSPMQIETPLPGTPSPAADTETGDADDDDGPDILLLALITIAAVGGAAVLFTLGYFLRKRIGYEPHRPPEGDEEGEGH